MAGVAVLQDDWLPPQSVMNVRSPGLRQMLQPPVLPVGQMSLAGSYAARSWLTSTL